MKHGFAQRIVKGLIRGQAHKTDKTSARPRINWMSDPEFSHPSRFVGQSREARGAVNDRTRRTVTLDLVWSAYPGFPEGLELPCGYLPHPGGACRFRSCCSEVGSRLGENALF